MSDPADTSTATGRIDFKFGEQVMPVIIARDIVPALAEHCAQRGFDRIFLIADTTPWEIYGGPLQQALGNVAPVTVELVEPVEKYKRLGTVERLLEQAMIAHISRHSVVIDFGGGLVGNVAGMVATLLYRGISLITVPTTLLAMTDSILSLKQAVNCEQGKNLFGTYYMPERAFLGTGYLQTLGDDQFAAGLIEFVKNCLTFDADSTGTLLDLMRETDRLRMAGRLITLGMAAKQRLLRDDPKERGRAILLEYGHTVGHALEHQGYGLTHGIAVGLGMVVAATISWRRGWLGIDELHRHYELIKMAGGVLEFPPQLDIPRTIRIIGYDNKHGYLDCEPGLHPFVLLRHIGELATTDNLPLVRVSDDEIASAIEDVRRKCRGGGRSVKWEEEV